MTENAVYGYQETFQMDTLSRKQDHEFSSTYDYAFAEGIMTTSIRASVSIR